MVFGKVKEPTQKEQPQQENDAQHLNWYGMQFLRRAKGTNEITQRSFPFWGPSIQFAVDHAKQTNKLPKENRSYWTHIKVNVHLIETKEGSNLDNDMAEHEVKL